MGWSKNINCLQKIDASICGKVPVDLAGLIPTATLKQCNKKIGLVMGENFIESKTDFETLEEICSRFC